MVLCLSQDGACTDSFENFCYNSLKGGLSNATTFNPPLFSLVDTFKAYFSFVRSEMMVRKKSGSDCMHLTIHCVVNINLQDCSLQFVKYLAGYIYCRKCGTAFSCIALCTCTACVLLFCGGVYLHNPSHICRVSLGSLQRWANTLT